MDFWGTAVVEGEEGGDDEGDDEYVGIHTGLYSIPGMGYLAILNPHFAIRVHDAFGRPYSKYLRNSRGA